MKFVHLSDLHIGKRVNEFSMIEDQKYILKEIIGVLDFEKPDAVLISGDVYDKPVPSAEAVELFDSFLTDISKRNIQIFIISGNHDSAERIAFGAELMKQSRVYLSPMFNGKIEPVELSDEYGEINFYLLPFLKLSVIKSFYPDEQLNTYTEAFRKIISDMNIDASKRNILLAHQFVTGAVLSQSEDISVGGLDNIDADVFKGFDYTALGHIHREQHISSNTVRYCGTPLKYSFSECHDKKSVTVVEMLEKGNIKITAVPLVPLHDMAEIRGTYEEITSKDFRSKLNENDYFHITLTDENDVLDAVLKLRIIYKNIMKLDYDNARTRQINTIESSVNENQAKAPCELFAELFELQNNMSFNNEQQNIVEKLIEEIWEERR